MKGTFFSTGHLYWEELVINFPLYKRYIVKKNHSVQRLALSFSKDTEIDILIPDTYK